MSVLALKALSAGVDKLPDSAFHKIPGGFFTPPEKKNNKKKDPRKERDARHRSEERARRNRDRRPARTPTTDHSDFSGYDTTDYESDYYDRQRNRRAKSLGRSPDRDASFNRGRFRERSFDGEYDMDRAERGGEYPPQPGSEYRQYNPADYAPPSAGYDHYDRRNSPVRPEYGYSPQPSAPRDSVSSSAAKYTPAAAYAPSPVNGAYAQPHQGYAPYNPSDYAAPPAASYSPQPAAYTAPGNSYPSPPPFYRQESRSQPSLPQQVYPGTQLAYPEPPREDSRSSSRRHHRKDKDGKRHRARSADQRGRSRSRVADKFRERLDGFDMHDKSLAASVGGALAGGLAGRAVGHGTLSTLAGAAIGAFGGREFEKKYEKKKSARESSRPRERSKSRNGRRNADYSRSPSRDRRKKDKYDDYDSYSESDSDDHRRATRRRRRNSRRSRRNSDERD